MVNTKNHDHMFTCGSIFWSEQQEEDEACGGAAQAAAEGHIWVPHREGDGGLDVRLIQQRSFFMFTFMIFSNTFNIIWTNIPSRDMWLQPVRIP